PHHRLRSRSRRGRGRLGTRTEPSTRRRFVSRIDTRSHRTFRAEHDGSGRGSTYVTQTEDVHAPEFQAADRGPQEDLGWFRTFLRKYTNSFSVARSSLFWALLRRQKKTLKWLLIVLIVYTIGLLQVTNLTRGMIDNGIVNQVAPLWPYIRYITFWALWSMVFSFAQ